MYIYYYIAGTTQTFQSVAGSRTAGVANHALCQPTDIMLSRLKNLRDIATSVSAWRR